jgi:hypothetical protein
VFALFCTLPAVLLNKYPSDTNSVAQSESTGEHNGLAVDGGRGFLDVVVGTTVVVIGTFVVVIGTFVVVIGTFVVVIGTFVVVIGTFVVVIGTFVVVIGTFVVIIGFSVGGFTGSVNEAHSILSPTKSAY